MKSGPMVHSPLQGKRGLGLVLFLKLQRDPGQSHAVLAHPKLACHLQDTALQAHRGCHMLTLPRVTNRPFKDLRQGEISTVGYTYELKVRA